MAEITFAVIPLALKLFKECTDIADKVGIYLNYPTEIRELRNVVVLQDCITRLAFRKVLTSICGPKRARDLMSMDPDHTDALLCALETSSAPLYLFQDMDREFDGWSLSFRAVELKLDVIKKKLQGLYPGQGDGTLVSGLFPKWQAMDRALTTSK